LRKTYKAREHENERQDRCGNFSFHGCAPDVIGYFAVLINVENGQLTANAGEQAEGFAWV